MLQLRPYAIFCLLACAIALALASCAPGQAPSQPDAQASSTSVVRDATQRIATTAAQMRERKEAQDKAAAEEAARKAAEQKAAEEAAKKKAEEEAAAKKKAEEEAARKKAEEEAARKAAEEEAARKAAEQQAAQQQAIPAGGSAAEIFASMDIVEDYRASFVHGSKPADAQKYIMLHDTEGESTPEATVDYWDSNGSGVAAHFIVGRDGHVVQCVGLDQITHHAGFGNTGNNAAYGVEDESRDDKVGTVPLGDWAADYGMNSYSIGIEMVHVGGGAPYTEEQLAAVDKVIAYIDAYYGFPSTIIDHKAWRSSNSDTSPEFAGYLANYQATRHH